MAFPWDNYHTVVRFLLAFLIKANPAQGIYQYNSAYDMDLLLVQHQVPLEVVYSSQARPSCPFYHEVMNFLHSCGTDCEVFYKSPGFLISFLHASNPPSNQGLVICCGLSLMANLSWKDFGLLYTEESVKCIFCLDSWNTCVLCEH